MGPRGHYIYDYITKYMYSIQHTPFRPQVKLYMYNEYYVKKKLFTEREIVSWNSTNLMSSTGAAGARPLFEF